MTRRRKKHRPEEVVAKLRDADAMLNARRDLAAVLRALEVSESARTVEALWAVCGDVLGRFTETECRNCFPYCGYRYT